MPRCSRPLLAVVALIALGFPAAGQTVVDPDLAIRPWVTPLSGGTGMAFIGPDEVLWVQKHDGQVRRAVAGVVQPGNVLDVSVNSFNERGMLGIATDPDFVNNRSVFLYYTEAAVDGGAPLANRVYRYTWNGTALVDPHLVLDLPVTPGPNHNGGVVLFGPDDKLYTVIGDLNRVGQLQNQASGPAPDDTGVILRTNPDGTAPSDNPFFDALPGLARVFAYGVRNSFGMAIDPLTGALWDTENGPSDSDEINRVAPGFNSGWSPIMGPDARDPEGLANLWVAPGSHYSDPEFTWAACVAPTSIAFIGSPKLGCERAHAIVVGDTNCGQLSLFRPNAARDGLTFSDPDLQDLVADNPTILCAEEMEEVLFGSFFGVVTDIETGPDGALYVLSLTFGTIYRIAADLPAALDADGDEVEDACDCNVADAGAWSAPTEVPRVRVSGGAPTSLGWDAQSAASGTGTRYDVVSGSLADLRAQGGYASACSLATGLGSTRYSDARPLAADEGFYYLVRAANGCGSGTFGDGSGIPDPRDPLDAVLPPTCP